MEPQFYNHQQPFHLEAGGLLPEITIAYHTWGKLTAAGDNVIWICHALTANANAADWWKGLVGDGCAFDSAKNFIVCANIIGSCYGSTGPLSINPETGKAYLHSFPAITIRDIVAAHEVLRQHLGIKKIALLAGGSLGGYQVLEWSLLQPAIIEKQFLIVTSAKETAWGIAIHTAQRMAIETDERFANEKHDGGEKGLATARAIGMLTYRNYKSFVQTQTDDDKNKLSDFRASSYIKYQAKKLTQRFNAYSYYTLINAMDTHNIARNREGNVKDVLQRIIQPTLVIGITGDVLCPVEETAFLASNLADTKFVAIDSLYGHDGFLVEVSLITKHIKEWQEKLEVV
ncbi:MAG: homoserine O-acetyltransferase [Bacteroidota bacterium]